MTTFKDWTKADVEAFNARVEATKQSRAGDTVSHRITSAKGAMPFAVAGPALESDLHDQIMDFCRPMGWLVVHSRMDRKTTTAKGVSDFVILTPKSVGFVEAKRKGNKPTKEQLAFLAHVKKMGWPNAVVYNLEEFKAFVADHLLDEETPEQAVKVEAAFDQWWKEEGHAISNGASRETIFSAWLSGYDEGKGCS